MGKLAACSRRSIAIFPSGQARLFHDYFVTHLPSSSLHPDSRSGGPRHGLPRAASKPHVPRSPRDPTPAPIAGVTRDTTVVRIPLRSAKHHFGVSISRGTRPYNEDTYQAGVIELPAFAKKSPANLTRAPQSSPLQAYRERQQRQQENERRDPATASASAGPSVATSADGASGDPQVFYFGVFDGHGGVECSDFLKDELHKYVEEAAVSFELGSSLKAVQPSVENTTNNSKVITSAKDNTEADLSGDVGDHDLGKTTSPIKEHPPPSIGSSPSVPQPANTMKVIELENALIKGWRELVGGYFRRFKPALFSQSESKVSDIATVLTFAFLRADYEFVRAQARKSSEGDSLSDAPLNESEILGSPAHKIGGPARFKGGSTCSIVLLSTPTPTPFWHPTTPSSMIVAHVGDTRIILCKTSTGSAVPLTTDHHPGNPGEMQRLRKFAGAFVTDSFGEERISGLANTRAFGDMQSKRMGVSAEPEVRRIELAPAEYSFMVLISDGISGTLPDQEIIDIVKEAKTPEQGAKDVVSFATEVSAEGDNATCLVVRLGGWERRGEGGLGSLGTKESRDWRRQEAADPRNRRN